MAEYVFKVNDFVECDRALYKVIGINAAGDLVCSNKRLETHVLWVKLCTPLPGCVSFDDVAASSPRAISIDEAGKVWRDFVEKEREKMLAEGEPKEPEPQTDIVARLRNYDTCHDGDIDEAANLLEELLARQRESVIAEATGKCRREPVSLARVGVDISLGREIVREKVTFTSAIWCEWTDGERGCSEIWKHESTHGISVRDALDLAALAGWTLVCGRPVCGDHATDPDGCATDDIARMRKHFGQ